MKNCKNCNSTNIVHVSGYEHIDEEDNFIIDDGDLCMDCECFHLPNGDFEFFVESVFEGSNITTANQLV